MRKEILFSLFLFCSAVSHAQPGGGGDLVIEGFTDEYGNPIYRSDSTFDFFILPSESASEREDGKFPYYLSYYLNGSANEPVKLTLNKAYSRLLICRGEEMMFLEFIDMLGENASGRNDYIQKMEFIPGFAYTLSRGFIKGNYPWKWDDDETWLSEYGIKNLRMLEQHGLVKREPFTERDKKKLKELDAESVWNQAVLYSQVLQRFEKSILYSLEVIEDSKDEMRSQMALSNIFFCFCALQRHSDAREMYLANKQSLKKAIYGYALIDLLRKINLKQEILEVYDDICSQSDYAWYWYNRGMYKLEELKDPKGAILDFNHAIQQCKEVNLNEADIFEYCEFNRAFWVKGIAQLKWNNFQEGPQNLLKASVYFINNTQLPSYIKSIDSLQTLYPDHAIIHLTAALLYSKSATEQVIQSPIYLDHIQRAQDALSKVDRGEEVFLWWMVKANLLRAMMKPNEAIAAAKGALNKSPNAKSPYRFQYVVYLTQLPNETKLLKEAYKLWTSDTK